MVLMRLDLGRDRLPGHWGRRRQAAAVVDWARSETAAPLLHLADRHAKPDSDLRVAKPIANERQEVLLRGTGTPAAAFHGARRYVMGHG